MADSGARVPRGGVDSVSLPPLDHHGVGSRLHVQHVPSARLEVAPSRRCRRCRRCPRTLQDSSPRPSRACDRHRRRCHVRRGGRQRVQHVLRPRHRRQSPSVFTNMVASIEQHGEWITDCIDHLERNGLSAINSGHRGRRALLGRPRERIRRAHPLRSLPVHLVLGSQHSGKPRVFLRYVGGVAVYGERLTQAAANGYEGTVITRLPQPVSEAPEGSGSGPGAVAGRTAR